MVIMEMRMEMNKQIKQIIHHRNRIHLEIEMVTLDFPSNQISKLPSNHRKEIMELNSIVETPFQMTNKRRERLRTNIN